MPLAPSEGQDHGNGSLGVRPVDGAYADVLKRLGAVRSPSKSCPASMDEVSCRWSGFIATAPVIGIVWLALGSCLRNEYLSFSLAHPIRCLSRYAIIWGGHPDHAEVA